MPEILDRLHDSGPLLTLAIVILAGMLFGAGARRLRLPGITGQIVAGVLIGRAGLDLFGEEPLHALQPITHFALGLMAVTVGSHLNVRRLRNAGKRLFFLLLTETTVTPVLVFVVLFVVGGVPTNEATLYATVAIATAPATVVALVKEARAKGVFVKTLIAAVALNNMSCIFLFEVARAFGQSSGVGEGAGLADALAGPIKQLVLAIAIGGTAAVTIELIARYVVRRDHRVTAALAGLALTSGIADFLGVSPLLACLFLGFVQTNIGRSGDSLIDQVFDEFQPVILTVFFTLAGMHLSFDDLDVAGFLALLLFGSRVIGKMLAARLAMRFAHATERVKQNLGIALVPQAGLAVALVILIQEDANFAHVAELFSAVVLTVVTANEIVGPILTRLALARTGEAGMDRMRLIDFLQEENIVTDFGAGSKQEAIERLVDLLIASHDLRAVDRNALLESVLERESQASTCLGGGLAVPHGILPAGQPMVGVMGLSRDGLALDAPDGQPVHCLVLLGTAPDERDRHLQVLAALARTIGTDPAFQTRLYNAKSPAHASELLHGEESVGFNYFLGDESV